MDERAILTDPAWLPHRYDEASDSFRFVHVPRGAHRSATFLTDDYLTGTHDFVAIPRAAIDKGSLSASPQHFVFHSAYCCSTLVARMFDAEGLSMGLKEPQVLNDIVGWRRRGAAPQDLAAVLDMALALLARPFGDGEVTVVKPSNIVNSIAPAILGLRPDARAIQLYAPIEDFLSSIAVKGLWGRQWVRQALVGQARDGVLSHRFSTEELLELTDLQVAALGWLSNHGIFARMREKYGPDRVAICDSVSLLRQPSDTVRGFYDYFGCPLDDVSAEAIAEGEAFTRNSKDRKAYSPEDRRKRLDETLSQSREEIEMVSDWVRHLAAGIGLDTAPEPSGKLL
ncbi:hypothetical protein K3172_12615 [Qipengyuania sp. 6B39]|uniref:hypothetical protein n=1 Tax=Qipengyuania proteolytica TaxID=2867239 RepID=UPI001C895970|nr:hypothetical protein [Qipengyuania proteolytica]MBX7496700.1 hypothetical protein [Qipengyuania proteolytica]